MTQEEFFRAARRRISAVRRGDHDHLGIDIEVHKQVIMDFNGPTAYWDVTFQNGEPVYGEYYYCYGDDEYRYSLSDEEMQVIVKAYGLEETYDARKHGENPLQGWLFRP